METNLADAAFPQANGEVVRGKNHLDNLDNDGEKYKIIFLIDQLSLKRFI